MDTISIRLKELRKEKDVMQKDVANFLDISSSAYGFYEQGKRTPTSDIVVKLAKYFDVSTDYLLGKTDERNYHLVQAIARINRLTNYENLDVTKLDKDTLIDIIQDMIGKIDNTYILKQLFLLIYHQLDTYELIDKVNDKDLVKLRNHLAHNKPSDDELRDFLKIYRNNKGLPK